MQSTTERRSEIVGGGPSARSGNGAALARGLGWFSLGLGLAELAAPRTIARMIGVDARGRTATAMRAVGAREIAHGVGILARPQRPEPVTSRLIGDLIDLVLLGWAAGVKRTNGRRLLGAIVSVLGVTALDVVASRRAREPARVIAHPVIRAITIHRPVSEVYAFWRDLERLPQFMTNVQSVRDLGHGRSHWVVRLPVGGTAEWDAEITEDRPDQRLAWRSVRGAKIPVRGSVSFTPTFDRRGTEVRVEIQVGAPESVLGAAISKLFAGPQSEANLFRLKQILETGEVIRSDATAARGMHPARPSLARGGT